MPAGALRRSRRCKPIWSAGAWRNVPRFLTYDKAAQPRSNEGGKNSRPSAYPTSNNGGASSGGSGGASDDGASPNGGGASNDDASDGACANDGANGDDTSAPLRAS